MNSEQLIHELESTRSETLRYFALDEQELERTYAPGKWSVRFLLHHLADAETVLSERIRRTISEPKPVLWVFDPDRWASGLGYDVHPLAVSRAVYDSVRTATIHYVKRYYDSLGDHEFVHSSAGIRTLRQEMEKVAAHNAHHLAQIHRALGN